MPESGANLRAEYEGPTPDYFGARNIEDLSWKQLFDGLSCTECGRCNDNCPAAMSGKPLQPMNIIVDIKHHMMDRYSMDGNAALNLEEDENLILPGGVIDPDVLWSCTTCRACMEVCPVGNEHIPDIVDMRRYLTMSLGEVGHGGQRHSKVDRSVILGVCLRDREVWTEDMTPVQRWDAEALASIFIGLGVRAHTTTEPAKSLVLCRALCKSGCGFLHT